MSIYILKAYCLMSIVCICVYISLTSKAGIKNVIKETVSVIAKKAMPDLQRNH